jgi:hypothetical protein
VSSDFPKTWRTYLLLLLFLAGESALFVHQQDISLHDHDTNCSICLHAPSSGAAPETDLQLVTHGDLSEQAATFHQHEIIAVHFPSDHLTRAPPFIS